MNFKRDYQGPSGPHLNCLTHYTRDGSFGKSVSIHPDRNKYSNYPSDTSKPAKKH